MNQTLVSAEQLTVGYLPDQPALSNLTFKLSAGESVGVLGPNGSGKTTLLRALLSELPPQAGRCETVGAPAYVPQTERTRLDFPLTAADVALMGAYGRTAWYRRVSHANRALTKQTLTRLGLAATQQQQNFGQLSGGQRQRVLIARALVQDTQVVLLDEPFSGVDRPSAQRIMSVIDELRDEGKVVMITTHDIDQARHWDRVLCLNGRQVAFGSPAETLTPEVLQTTYGSEIVLLDDGSRAIAVQHHHH